MDAKALKITIDHEKFPENLQNARKSLQKISGIHIEAT